MKETGQLVFKSEEEQQKELQERINSWEEGQSKDGYIICAEGKFQYKKVFYLIKVLRYFNHTNKFCPMGSQRISDKHVIVEYPDETKSLVALIKQLDENSDFLWHDTLHSYTDPMTAEQQIEACHSLAKGDIDKLFNRTFQKELDAKIKKLKKLNKDFIQLRRILKK